LIDDEGRFDRLRLGDGDGAGWMGIDDGSEVVGALKIAKSEAQARARAPHTFN